MSLKQQLFNLIRDRGYVPYGQIVEFSLEYGAKISAAERRLRELTHPENSLIKPIIGKSKKGTSYIKGYEYREKTYPILGKPTAFTEDGRAKEIRQDRNGMLAVRPKDETPSPYKIKPKETARLI